MIIPFGSQSYTHRSKPLAAQRMLNTYLEQAPPSAKTLAANVPSFGIANFATVGNGPIRGGLVVNDQVFAVSGNALHRMGSGGSSTALGTVPNLDRCFMAGDGTNVLIASGGNGYLYNGASVAQIADPDFPGALACDFLDGYFIVIEPNSGRAFVNETPYVPSDWNALDYATAEGGPDDLLSVLVDHREAALFGRENTEFWYNSGAADFPLDRTPSGFIELGILSTHACAKADNSIFFAAHDLTIRRINGYTPVRISTHAVEQAIESYTDRTCYCTSFTESGHTMVSFTFAAGTWVYDIATGLWHERGSYGYAYWRPSFVLRAFRGRQFACDSISNRIGELTPDVFTEWGQPLIASSTSPAIARENQRLRNQCLELVFETGVGTASSPNPQVMLQWSDDGGRTWSNEYTRTLGAVGRYRTRARWNRLGSARDRVYRYSISDPVRRTLTQATLDAA